MDRRDENSDSYEYAEKKSKLDQDRSSGHSSRDSRRSDERRDERRKRRSSSSDSEEERRRDRDRRDSRRDRRDYDRRDNRDYDRQRRDRDYDRREDRDRGRYGDDRRDRDRRDDSYRRDRRDEDRRGDRYRDERRDESYRRRRDGRSSSSSEERRDSRRDRDRSEREDRDRKTTAPLSAEDKQKRINDMLRKEAEELERKKKQEYEAMEKELNPTLVVESCNCKKADGRMIKLQVVRDDNLIGGTKQRAIYKLLEAMLERAEKEIAEESSASSDSSDDSDDSENEKVEGMEPDQKEEKQKGAITEFVFTGSTNSFIQVALALSCNRLKKRATLFVQNPHAGKVPALTNLSKRLGATTQVFYDQLADVQERAAEYVDVKNKKVRQAMLFPLTLDSEEFCDILYNQLRRSVPSTLQPKRVWLTIATGSLLKALGKLWPQAQFMAVQVGKKLTEAQFPPDLWARMGGQERMDLLAAPQKRDQNAPINLVPPFASVPSFDAKVWQFIVKYGDEGDMIWNCAQESVQKHSI